MTVSGTVRSAVFAVALTGMSISTGTAKLDAQSISAITSAKMLFCVDGPSSGLVPRVAPPGYEWWLAVAVVQVSSGALVSNVPVGDFALLGDNRYKAKAKRLMQIDQFDAPLNAEKERYVAYWLDADAHPWNGTLQKGVTRLRIRVALDVPLGQFPPLATPMTKNRCIVTVGPHKVEGPLNAVWPS